MSAASGHLVVKSTVGSGLGDRVRTVISALLYARESGRSLHVFWDDGLYGPEGENVFPEFFTLTDLPREPLDLDRACRTRPVIWSGELRQAMKVLYRVHGPERWDRAEVIRRFSFDQSRLDYDDEVLVMWEFDQFGACLRNPAAPGSGWEDLGLVRELAARHLRLSAPLRGRVDALKGRRFRSRMIGVHIRDTTEEGCRVKRIAEERYHRLIRRFLHEDPGLGIFLATDNRDAQERFLGRYGERVVTAEKWFGAPGEALHLSADRGDPRRNAEEALTDLFLLAECDYLIFPAWSSFSLTASYFFQGQPNRIVPLRGEAGRLARIKGLGRRLAGWMAVRA